jgi:hypothetical protein
MIWARSKGMSRQLACPLGAEHGRDLRYQVGREAAAAGVLEHVLGALGVVDAVDLVARHVGVAPGVGARQPLHRLVGLLGDAAQLLLGQLAGTGDLAFDEVVCILRLLRVGR